MNRDAIYRSKDLSSTAKLVWLFIDEMKPGPTSIRIIATRLSLADGAAGRAMLDLVNLGLVAAKDHPETTGPGLLLEYTTAPARKEAA